MYSNMNGIGQKLGQSMIGAKLLEKQTYTLTSSIIVVGPYNSPFPMEDFLELALLTLIIMCILFAGQRCRG